MAEPNGAGPQAWSAERFRAERSRTVELPSGMVVRLRAVMAVDLAVSGQLPEPLAQHVFREVAEIEGDLATPAERVRARLEKVEAINAVCCAIVAEPEVVPVPALTAEAVPEGAIVVSELEWTDRLRLFAIACGQVEATLARFPGEPAGGVSPAPDGDGLLDAPELDARAPTG